MRFEPLLFIRMAQENGIELTRIERNIRIINASTLWTAAIKKHKRQLLRSCLETPASSQAIQHNAGHGDVNPGFVGASETLIAFAEAA
jgi:hypothetical protein